MKELVAKIEDRLAVLLRLVAREEAKIEDRLAMLLRLVVREKALRLESLEPVQTHIK